MRCPRLAAVAIVALALSALAPVSATALPEVGRCVARPGTGKYKDAGCTEKAGTKATERQFEFLKGAERVGFSGSGGEAVLEQSGGSKLVCSSSSQSGKFDSDSGVIKEVESVVLTFKGCELPIFVNCQTKGAAEGEIITNLLKGPLGYRSGEKTASPVVGQELTPEKAKGLIAEFECTASVKLKVKGKQGAVGSRTGGNCIIAPLSAANLMSTTFSEAFAGKAGSQEPQHFQPATAKYCNLETNVNGGPFEPTTWTLAQALTDEEALEIKA